MNTPKTLTRGAVSKGFTLIELMIGIAIIGVLSAIAIPAFQDYLNRAKVTELMNIAQSCKAGIIEYAATTNAWPPGNGVAAAQAAGCQNNIAAQSQYAQVLTVTGNGRIQVNFQDNAVATGIMASHFIALVPWTGGARHTDPLQPIGEWRCVTNVPGDLRRYLPAACRNNNVG
ncbi:pilin [Limnobacter alexandrii]|jgi:type IV pilus assembly protein PilA|uniref:pilin n=1 Tax=Limnobacter alexandrii TaxID=2570352 RepID=UPI001109D2A7|nr:pilin [Limnobacter alexandrii]